MIKHPPFGLVAVLLVLFASRGHGRRGADVRAGHPPHPEGLLLPVSRRARARRKAGLDLRLRRLLVAGGDSGSAIVPGKPGESYLLERVRGGEMPPGKDAKKLSAEQVALIERWIAGGALDRSCRA